MIHGAFRPSHRVLRPLKLVPLLVLLVLVASDLPAPDLKPPLQALRDPNYTLVVAERTDQPVENRKMAFRVHERLQGNANVPDEIRLLVLDSDHEEIEIGTRYLVFFSDVERASMKAKTNVRRPDRAQLLHIDGAAPAVFPDTYAMRTLLGPDHSNVELDPQYDRIVMQGMQSDDPRMVDLWTAEWSLRPATFGTVRPENIALLSQIIEDPNQRPAARTRVLRTAAARTPAETGPWFMESANRVLESLKPAQLSENTGLSQLIYASLQVARSYPGDSSASQLEKWLRATPPLAENAALALRAINPELERQAVESAILAEDTPEKTRVFLNDHLRRLDLVEQRT